MLGIQSFPFGMAYFQGQADASFREGIWFCVWGTMGEKTQVSKYKCTSNMVMFQDLALKSNRFPTNNEPFNGSFSWICLRKLQKIFSQMVV